MVTVIIQARMGATRLPGKMMKDLLGKPVIAHVVDRVRLCKNVDNIWIATTENDLDDVLYNWAKDNSVNCYRGSEKDVLDRYYRAAKKANTDTIVRITGDCPLHDPETIDRVISEFTSESDYVSNIHPPTFPDGLDVEVFSFSSLEKAWQEAKLASEREHVTPYIWKNPHIFRMKNVENDEDLSQYRITLDTKEDLLLIKTILEYIDKTSILRYNMATVVDILKNDNDMLLINSKFERNEGYVDSVRDDKVYHD
ncbi:MAG: acylneuraminate cytidylyltransferase [Candidatus Magasanikbacteria bacterium]|nr:acylneuraminate cytidylyltransferase [Candidatus Magasanikbacteria bacterium]